LEEDFEGVVDLLERKAIVWHGEDLGARFEVVEVPPALRDEAELLRDRAVEQIAEVDDAVMERFLDGETLTVDELRAGLRRATVANRAIPVVIGAAYKTRGVQPLLDAVIDYLPSPSDIPPVAGVHPDGAKGEVRRAADEEPFAGLVFKIM